MELKWCQYKLVRPTELKTWIPTVLGLKFMGFLADLKKTFWGSGGRLKVGVDVFPFVISMKILKEKQLKSWFLEVPPDFESTPRAPK